MSAEQRFSQSEFIDATVTHSDDNVVVGVPAGQDKAATAIAEPWTIRKELISRHIARPVGAAPSEGILPQRDKLSLPYNGSQTYREVLHRGRRASRGGK